jgi:hypothetical protein
MRSLRTLVWRFTIVQKSASPVGSSVTIEQVRDIIPVSDGFRIHDSEMSIVAPSLRKWLQMMAEDLESGRFKVNSDSVWFQRP